ncbi:MAG: hypothetical protein P8X82_15260 [Gemmatimonadales bacterium]
MTVFIATSKQFYPDAKRLVSELRSASVQVYHPYFDLNPNVVDSDPDFKQRVTLQHFPEIDDSDVFYALTPNGYAGCSVTIELTYAYARGKRIIASEEPAEFALRALVAETCPPSDLYTRL